MNVLIIGGGGREHAIAWHCARDPDVRHVWVAPGNAGTGQENKVENVPIPIEDARAITEFARDQSVDLVIVGPEAPLVQGLVDACTRSGIRCFGPSQQAAVLEGSKVFTKEFCQRHGIPTAPFAVFSEETPALEYLSGLTPPFVIKADGLCAGKGVVVTDDKAVAKDTIHNMLSGARHGEAGQQVVIEEFLPGVELSFTVISDGENALPLVGVRDHKTRDDGDRGPNTGGMGAYSPVPLLDETLHHRVMQEIIHPTLEGMASEGRRYTGVLYAGLMILPDGRVNLLEFNCRLGDPEAQVILSRLDDSFSALCLAACEKGLSDYQLSWIPQSSVGVVLTAPGYPEAPQAGDPITGTDRKSPSSVHVFHAGTAYKEKQLVTAGGRVLCVTALGDDLAQARDKAYQAVGHIHWPGVHYRRDIGFRDLSK